MSKSSRRSSVSANISENRLLITLKGILSKKDLESIYTDIRFCVSDLQPGFNVISDMRECRFGHLSAIPAVEKIVDFLIYKKVGKIVRVVSKTRVLLHQLEWFAARRKDYTVHYVSTTQEAEELLGKNNKNRSAA